MNSFTKLILAIILILILTFIARFLWNNVLVKHVTILRPVKTLPETFLLALAISMFTPKR